jgi:LPS-assembly protein
MSSRGFIYEGKYRQLIAPKITEEDEHSLWEIETRFLHDDKITNLNRWLIDTSIELDYSEKIHLSTRYYRVSDKKYFEEIARTNTNVKVLTSHLNLSYEDKNDLKAAILSEDEQIVNSGTDSYIRALEGSISKTFRFGKKEDESNDLIATVLTEGEEVVKTRKPTTDLAVNFVSTKFDHDDYSKESGVRTHGNLNISRQLASPHFPIITPNVNFSLTHYNLNNSSDNITRTIAGGGVNINFSMNNKANLFGREINHRLSPIIQYNYRAKELQGNIPVFDSTDKYDDIITFSDLTSGERYTGLDRITNANDITLSIESSFRAEDALDEDKDLLIFRIAQSFYTDDEVVSDTANTNYETRKTYSDIAASVDVAINNFILSTAIQFDPDKSLIVKKENSLSYIANTRKFVSMSLVDDGTDRTGKIYAAYPLNDSIHLFAGLDKTITKATRAGVVNAETSGIAYESCCWALRLAHFKEDNGVGGHNYSTGIELVLNGLGSTSTPLQDRIENKIPDYQANLNYKP